MQKESPWYNALISCLECNYSTHVLTDFQILRGVVASLSQRSFSHDGSINVGFALLKLESLLRERHRQVGRLAFWLSEKGFTNIKSGDFANQHLLLKEQARPRVKSTAQTKK